MPAAVAGLRAVRGEGVGAVPVLAPPDVGGYSPLTVELRRAVRWAEAERDAAAGRAAEMFGQATAEPANGWRGYLWAAGEAARERAAWCDDLARWLADWLGRRVGEETRARVEREALAWLDRAT